MILWYCLSRDSNTKSSKYISEFIDIYPFWGYNKSAEVSIMANIVTAIKDTISISLFNRGLAGKIFEEVKRTGAKVVMKNNTAECVLLSPDEYVRLMDEVNDARLITLAANRLSNFESASVINEEEMNQKLGVKPEDLKNFEEVELE